MSEELPNSEVLLTLSMCATATVAWLYFLYLFINRDKD